jgi:type I restriction-modification system DNA methylase subunit
MARRKSSNAATQSSANIGFEAKLGLAADKLRNNMDAAEYKHVVLGLIFLKYISDTFEEHRAKLLAGQGDIRRALIEAVLVDCMVALPGQLFYSTQIPVCLWFLSRNKAAYAKRGFRDRRKEALFRDHSATSRMAA